MSEYFLITGAAGFNRTPRMLAHSCRAIVSDNSFISAVNLKQAGDVFNIAGYKMANESCPEIADIDKCYKKP